MIAKSILLLSLLYLESLLFTKIYVKKAIYINQIQLITCSVNIIPVYNLYM